MDESRLICSLLRELQEEHREGILSRTKHKHPWVRMSAGFLAEELYSEDKWFGPWVLDSIRSASGREVLTS